MPLFAQPEILVVCVWLQTHMRLEANDTGNKNSALKKGPLKEALNYFQDVPPAGSPPAGMSALYIHNNPVADRKLLM